MLKGSCPLDSRRQAYGFTDCGTRVFFQLRQPRERLSPGVATHLGRGLQPYTATRPLGLPENGAAHILRELVALHSCSFSLWHIWDWA